MDKRILLTYIVAVNKRGNVFIIDYKTDDKNSIIDICYETDFTDCETNIKKYMKDGTNQFDGNRILKKSGFYKITGESVTLDTFDDDYYSYTIKEVIKLGNLNY